MLRNLARVISGRVQCRTFWKGTRYTDTEEWIKITGERTDNGSYPAKIGITAHAKQSMGDIVYLEVSDHRTMAPDEALAEMESTKATSELKVPGKFTIKDENTHGVLNVAQNEEELWIVSGELHDDITEQTISSDEYNSRS